MTMSGPNWWSPGDTPPPYWWNPGSVPARDTLPQVNLPTDSAIKIRMIWAKDSADPDAVAWLVYAADEDTIEVAGTEAWDKALDAAEHDHGASNIRIMTTEVSWSKVRAAFDWPEV